MAYKFKLLIVFKILINLKDLLLPSFRLKLSEKNGKSIRAFRFISKEFLSTSINPNQFTLLGFFLNFYKQFLINFIVML